MEQRSDEWFQARLGKVTASRVADIMSKTKSGYSASRKNYMMELLCERLTGASADGGYMNAAMARGNELEPVARGAYEVITDEIVDEVGLVDHPEIEGFAASPDGLVGDDGLVEIKCPNTATHVEFLRTGDYNSRYRYQMMAQLACTGREWCDFVSFDDRLPDALQYCSTRYVPKKDALHEMQREVIKFLQELDVLEAEMRELSKQRGSSNDDEK